MKKIILILFILLIIIFGIGGYFIGYYYGKQTGRLSLENEIKLKEESYQKSKEAAENLAKKYFDAVKYQDFKEVYSYICPEIKNKITEQQFLDFWKNSFKALAEKDLLLQEITVDDIIIDNNIVKARFTEILYSPVFKEIKRVGQSEFKLEDGKWCTQPQIE